MLDNCEFLSNRWESAKLDRDRAGRTHDPRGSTLIIDYLISKDGLRLHAVDVSMHGIRLVRGPSGLVPASAERVDGSLRLTLGDLSAALARPELVDQLFAGLPGIARPELTFDNDADGGIRITGSVEALGRRIPISASTRVRVANDRLVVAATSLEGLPLLKAIPVQLLDLELPIALPLGLRFTDVRSEEGALVLFFEGHDIDLRGPQPVEDRPTPEGGKRNRPAPP